jgi:hypothetical protein
MESLRTRVVQAACSTGVLHRMPLEDVDGAVERIRSRLVHLPGSDIVVQFDEVRSTLCDVERAWRAARLGARSVWRGTRPAMLARRVVARRLGGDEQAAEALFAEALFESR